MSQRRTQVSIDGDAWLINGRPTYEGFAYRGWRIEGLLLNSRMVQATFDDENGLTRMLWAYPDTGEWDPERNTTEFLAAMTEWREHGLLGISVNFQGGCPLGYYRPVVTKERLRHLGVESGDDQVWAGLPGPDSQPWHNSAFDAGSHLKRPYMDRLTQVLDRADSLGMIVILGLFYFGQDERLGDEQAVRQGVEETCNWVLEQGYTNVVVEIANECNVPRYEYEILQPHRIHELIELAKGITHGGQRLLVGTSYGGGRVPDDSVVAVSDFILMHGNGVTEPDRIAQMVDEARSLPSYRAMPVLFNEDDHFNFHLPRNNFTAALSQYAG